MEFDSYAFVILRRGPRAAEYDGEAAERLQDAHLAHLREMHEAGKLAVAGPFRDQEDETLRGICIYTTPVEEARELAARDPSVRAGRMAVEAMTWLTHKRALRWDGGGDGVPNRP
jgi:uncharacterized protein YciI